MVLEIGAENPEGRVAGKRFGIKITLNLVAPAPAQKVPLLAAFDALGHHGKAELVAEPDSYNFV